MQPIKDRGDATKRAKRLAKSLRRRTEYVENLRRSATRERLYEEPLHTAFADMIDSLADQELELARAERDEANALNDYLQGPASQFSHYPPEERKKMEEHHAAVMERIGGRLSSDRVRHLSDHLGATGSLESIEVMLGLERGDKLYLKRVEAAEVAAFGAVRFD